MNEWLVTSVWLLALALVLTMAKTFQLARSLRQYETGEHAKCTAHVAHYVGNSFAATVLEAAGEDYDSARGQHRVAVLRHMDKPPEGVSIPALWMKDRAQRLREQATTMDGADL